LFAGLFPFFKLENHHFSISKGHRPLQSEVMAAEAKCIKGWQIVGGGGLGKYKKKEFLHTSCRRNKNRA